MRTPIPILCDDYWYADSEGRERVTCGAMGVAILDLQITENGALMAQVQTVPGELELGRVELQNGWTREPYQGGATYCDACTERRRIKREKEAIEQRERWERERAEETKRAAAAKVALEQQREREKLAFPGLEKKEPGK